MVRDAVELFRRDARLSVSLSPREADVTAEAVADSL